MEIRTYKIFSYCDDFTEEEQEILQENQGCDVFVEYLANTELELKNQGYSNDIISNKLRILGANKDEKVLIHLDW